MLIVSALLLFIAGFSFTHLSLRTPGNVLLFSILLPRLDKVIKMVIYKVFLP